MYNIYSIIKILKSQQKMHFFRKNKWNNKNKTTQRSCSSIFNGIESKYEYEYY